MNSHKHLVLIKVPKPLSILLRYDALTNVEELKFDKHLGLCMSMPRDNVHVEKLYILHGNCDFNRIMSPP